MLHISPLCTLRIEVIVFLEIYPKLPPVRLSKNVHIVALQSYCPCSAFDKVPMDFLLDQSNWFPNCQSKDKEALKDFKGLSQDGGGGGGQQNSLRISALSL
jgi:hypothetical protein